MPRSAVKQQQQHVEASNARTVVVACAVPNGLRLQLQRPFEKFEDTRGGPEKRTYNVFHGRVYVIRGPAYPTGTLPKGFEQYKPRPHMEGSYALTRGIPKDFWEQWLEQNKESEFVVPPDGSEHGAIFAYDDLDDVAAAARNDEDYRTGLEPISTDEKDGRLTDPRLPKPMTGDLSGIAEEKR